MKKAVFLDRDGVINKAFIKDGLPLSPNSLEKLEILPGVKESILKLKKLNFICLVVTNQPDVSRGKIKKKIVIKMNNFLKKEIKLDDVFVCYHDDKDNCNCRKPKPGLLLQASRKWNVDFKKSFMIGDRWKDIQAGVEVGCKTIFLDYNYKDIKPKNPSFVTDTLLNAVYMIKKFSNEKKKNFKTKIFCDTADIKVIKRLNNNPLVAGFTTNPSLMKLSGAKNYKNYSKQLLKICNKKPISLEVIADEFKEIEKQAYEIKSWGNNVYVKIPITNSNGNFSGKIIKRLSNKGLKLNITAVYTVNQVKKIVKCLNKNSHTIISIFSGRMADAGKDPVPIIQESVRITKKMKKIQILWASTREAYNYYQANNCQCGIITMPPKIIEKISKFGKSFKALTLDTVKTFYKDAVEANFKIN